MGFRDRFLTRRTAEALTAPAAIVLAGAGTAAAVLAGAAPGFAGLAGAAAYAAWVAWRMPRAPADPAAGIDLRRLRDPWQTYVKEVLDARERYRRLLSSVATGPLHDRLVQVGTRVDDALAECQRIASRGQQLEDALAQLVPEEELRERLARLEAAPPTDTNQRLAEALRGQADSARRIGRTAQDARERLQVLDVRLDEIVARAVELGLRVDDPVELGELGADVDALVGEMEALRRGLDETAGQTAVG